MNNSYKYISKYMLKWLIISSIVGVGGGLSAYALTTLIKVISNKSDFFPIWIAPVIGGIIVSIIYLWDKKAAGFGTDHYIVAGNSNTIRLKIKTYFSKLAATVVTLGFKGSGGVEGPMLVIGGSLSDGISKIPILKHRLSKDDYRTLVICGAAGAIGAVFKSPLAGGILAVELLYKTSLHYSDLFPAMLSSTMGFVIYSMLAGAEPIFTIPDYLPNPFNVPLFILAGILGGISSILFMYIFKKANEVFGKMKYKNIHPIIGGFLTGLVLLLVPQAGGTGTSVIQELINNNLPIVFLLVLLLGKILATTFTVGSGGSAGLVIPALFIGAVSGNIISSLIPNSDGLSASLVISGMSASFASIANVPISAAIMVVEMAGLRLGVPAAIGSVVGYTIGHSQIIYGNTCEVDVGFEQLKGWRENDRNESIH